MDFEFVAGEFADQPSATTNLSKEGIIFLAENVMSIIQQRPQTTNFLFSVSDFYCSSFKFTDWYQ